MFLAAVDQTEVIDGAMKYKNKTFSRCNDIDMFKKKKFLWRLQNCYHSYLRSIFPSYTTLKKMASSTASQTIHLPHYFLNYPSFWKSLQ